MFKQDFLSSMYSWKSILVPEKLFHLLLGQDQRQQSFHVTFQYPQFFFTHDPIKSFGLLPVL